MKNPTTANTEDDLSSSVESCNSSDTKAGEADEAFANIIDLPEFYYQLDELEDTVNDTELVDDHEEDSQLSGSLDALASLLLSHLLNSGNTAEESAHPIFDLHENTAQQSELTNMLTLLHRTRFNCGHHSNGSHGQKSDGWLASWMVDDDDPAPSNEAPAEVDVPGSIGALASIDAKLEAARAVSFTFVSSIVACRILISRSHIVLSDS